MKTSHTFAIVTIAATLTAGLLATSRAADDPKAHMNAWATVTRAVAILHPTAGNKAQGKVTFTQVGDKVKVVAEIEGLVPGVPSGGE